MYRVPAVVDWSCSLCKFVVITYWLLYFEKISSNYNMYMHLCHIPEHKSIGQCKKDITPLLMHWSYVFLALTHQNVVQVTGIDPHRCGLSCFMESKSCLIMTWQCQVPDHYQECYTELYLVGAWQMFEWRARLWFWKISSANLNGIIWWERFSWNHWKH